MNNNDSFSDLDVNHRLEELGISIPQAVAPVASYIPAKTTGTYVYTSGQLPFQDGTLLFTGKVDNSNLDKAKTAAELATINALAAIKGVIGDLNRIANIVKVVGFVSSDPNFTQQPQVINGASDFIEKVFGQRGIHARSAVGVAVLPLDSPVEVELIVEVEH